MELLIGTSGWSYDDWVGNFYPERLRNAKNQWLEFYGSYLSTVEINSTFYRMPEEFVVNSWIKKTAEFDKFEFSLKLPQLVTHEAIVKDSGEKAAQIARSFEKKCINPLAENKLLGAVLIQLSPYFRRTDPKSKADNLPKLRRLLEVINTSEYNYAAEFRHSSWLNPQRNDLGPETIDLLKEFNVANCLLDGPGFPRTRTDTATHGYVRFHGRNRDIWFKGRKADKMSDEYKAEAGATTGDTRMNRYDYLYTVEELQGWLERLNKYQESKGTKARIYFNNHPNAQAVKNAFMLMDLMGMPRKPMDVKLQKQVKLESF